MYVLSGATSISYKKNKKYLSLRIVGSESINTRIANVNCVISILLEGPYHEALTQMRQSGSTLGRSVAVRETLKLLNWSYTYSNKWDIKKGY